MSGGTIDFGAVIRAALARLPELVARWLPDGRRHGAEWVARKPQREIRWLMQEAQQLYGLVVLDLALIRDEQERALVSRLARQQRAAKR